MMTRSHLVKSECGEGPHYSPKTPDHRILGLLRLVTCASLLCCALSAHVEAYVFISSPPTVWPNGTIPMDLQLGSTLATPLMDGNTSWKSVAENALATWNLYINTVKFTVYTQSPKAHASGDGINQVFFYTDVYGLSFGAGVLATTTTWSIGTTRTEGDTVFNSTLPWNSYRGNLLPAASGGTLLDFQRVALHEFGHTLGLGHPDLAGQNVLALMNSMISNLDHLTADDTTGAFVLYGGLPPSIVTQPQSQTVAVGNTVTFSVAASGSQPLSYQWKCNGVNISGATSASYTISSVQTSQAGNYTVVVSNAGGTATSAGAVLTVNVPPFITAPPQSQTVMAGNSVALSVTASGTAPLSYQWYRNNSAIAGATAAGYTISATPPSDAGDYKVRVSNVAGSVDSAVATLTVQFAPVITGQPQGQTVIVGDIVTFTAAAGGVPTPSYQWRFNGNPIPSASQASYTISSVRTNDAGNYSVAISNAVGQTNSAAVTLAVLVPFPGVYNTGLSGSRTLLSDGQVDPHYKLVVNPNNPASSDSVVQDSTAFPIVGGPWVPNSSISKWIGPALNTTGAAAGNYIYQLTLDLTGYDPGTAFLAGSWAADDSGSIFLNGVDTGFSSAGFSVPSTFSLTNGFVSGTNLIEFRVGNASSWTGLRVENLLGTAQSLADLPLCIVTQPTGATKVITDNVTFAVVAGGAPPLSYQWRLGSKILFGATTNSYTIANVQATNVGNYDVIVSNNSGSVTSAVARLTVRIPAAITQQPVSLVVTQGSSASFSVSASGDTPLSYQWYRNNSAVAGATNVSYTINATQPSDTGSYDVIVWNTSGSVTSAVATLTVQCAPIIITQPGSRTVNQGANVSFSVQASGVPTPAFQWSLNAAPITSATSRVFTLTNVQPSDAGTYSVAISNPLGQTNSANAFLAVLVPFPGIYDTGLSDSRTLLADGQVDPHYKLVVNPNNPASNDSVVQDSTAFPITGGPWVQNSSKSKWIGPAFNTSGAPAGNYIYQLTVDLTGYDPRTAFLAGSWAADDTGSIFLNGVDTGFSSAGFSVFSTFSLTNGFVLGTNLIEFRISNAAGPTGLRVENLQGTLQTETVPFVGTQPEGATNVIGDNVTFAVVAGGASPLRYQWRFNGADIPTATGASLELTNLQLSQAGNYAVIVTNAFGSALSSNAALTVNPALACVAPPSGLVGWWPGNGNANDSAGTNNGTLQNGASYAPGLVGQAFSFDGINDVVQVPSSPSLSFAPQAPMTVELWAYRTGSASIIHILGKRNGCGADPAAINYQMYFNVPSGQGLGFGGGGGAANSGLDMPTNTWTHLAGTFDGSNFHLYVNGGLVATNAGILGPQNTAPLLIGGSGDCAKFAGLIDEVSVYNRALTGSEIAAIYNAGNAGKCGLPPVILTISRADNGIRVAWPVSATGFVLQEMSSPAGSWTDSSAAVVVQGNENVAVIATTGTLKFYRLHK